MTYNVFGGTLNSTQSTGKQHLMPVLISFCIGLYKLLCFATSTVKVVIDSSRSLTLITTYRDSPRAANYRGVREWLFDSRSLPFPSSNSHSHSHDC